MTAVKHAFTELPTIDIRDLAGDDLGKNSNEAAYVAKRFKEC